MGRNDFELAYRQSTVAGASPIGMMIALYDRLSRDFRNAAAAIRSNDIEARCTALNHASIILGHLESWIDHRNGGELAANLAIFYSYLRSKMMEASVQQSAALLDAQIQLISQVRGAWQQKDAMDPRTTGMQVPVSAGMAYGFQPEQLAFSRSA